jgi:toxin ParE1/3/4
MKRPLRLDREAEEELEAAWRWYEERRPGLGREFLDSIKEALLRLEGPTVSLLVEGVPTDLGVRRLLVRRFPYSVVFVDLPTERRVLAIAHSRRRPGFWRKRLGRTE